MYCIYVYNVDEDDPHLPVPEQHRPDRPALRPRPLPALPTRAHRQDTWRHSRLSFTTFVYSGIHPYTCIHSIVYYIYCMIEGDLECMCHQSSHHSKFYCVMISTCRIVSDYVVQCI